MIAPLTIPILAKMFGWEMAFIVIGGLGFIWMGFWVFMYDAPSKSKHVNQAELDYIEQDNREAGSAPMTCLLYTSPSPRDGLLSRMPSSA